MHGSIKRRKKPQIRVLLSEFSSRLGGETLSIRIYHDHETFVCERQLVERDGTSITMVLPFKEPSAARVLLAADPYYGRVRDKVRRVLLRLDSVARGFHGK
jgi:hypothetical protein